MSREIDKELIQELPKEKIADFIFLHLRDLWAVDGLYYMGIEERYGTKIATEIDQFVWEVMGKIEARRLKEFFGLHEKSIKEMMYALQHSSWALDLEDKEIEIDDKKALIRNVKCRVQNTRIQKGLGEFGCKQVRKGFSEAFAKEFNSRIKLTCNVCPPDDHPDELWCEWEFSLTE